MKNLVTINSEKSDISREKNREEILNKLKALTLMILGERFAVIYWMLVLILSPCRSWPAMLVLLRLRSMIEEVRQLKEGRFRIWGFNYSSKVLFDFGDLRQIVHMLSV